MTDEAARILDVKPEWVTVVFDEYSRDNWATAGELHSIKFGSGLGQHRANGSEEKGGNDDLEARLNNLRVYSRNDLRLRPNVAGAGMWAVGLEKSMLTYFEMEPDTTFPEHSHEAEQITLVLEGELTFSYEGKIATLKAGDVIAVPSNIRHSVSTGGQKCRAVDAWSPVRKEYLADS